MGQVTLQDLGEFVSLGNVEEPSEPKEHDTLEEPFTRHIVALE